MKTIGSIGLGAMGGSYAKFLIEDNYTVYGVDPDTQNAEIFTSLGGVLLNNISELVDKSNVIILSLPTVPIFKEVINEIEVNGKSNESKILVDMNTISLDDKIETKNKLEKLNISMVDAPVSGTGAQAKVKDIVVMSSGDKIIVNECDEIFRSFSKQNIYVGDFGNGIKFKILANLLVTVHNTVTAEALLLGQKVGLEEKMIYEVLNAGAATSVMLDKRMPLMINKNYEPATASMRIFLKDIDVITDYLKSNNISSPTFEAAANLYNQSKENIPITYDTAAIYEQLKTNNE
jgi:3-hydroxyisobutyrate dehydrogenase-like beta-hydroxyacid dehydrogenase|tara:strand:+ start:451 stop:1323 length:873 start_codon:yes stop_codon:yes gene_type:complete